MDEQENLQRLALEECSVAFVKKLDPSAILPHLIAQHLLTDDDRQTLTTFARTQTEKAQYLVDIIPRKETGWFEKFLACLRQSADGTGHRDLVKQLEAKFQELLEKNVPKKKRVGSNSRIDTQQPVGRPRQNDRDEEVLIWYHKIIVTMIIVTTGVHNIFGVIW